MSRPCLLILFLSLCRTALAAGTDTFTPTLTISASSTPSITATLSASPTIQPTPVCTWETGEDLDWALGQADALAANPNQGGTVGAAGLSSPHSAIVVGSKLVVSDSGNNRVLIWNSLPASFAVPANIVIGQPDMASNVPNNDGGISARTLYSPAGLASDGTRLFIADSSNHRILVYNSLPGSDFAAASMVLGQSGFSAGSANAGGPATAATLNKPEGLAYAAGRLMAADSFNHRVLLYDGAALATGAPAQRLVGQSVFSATFPNTAANRLHLPLAVASDGSHLAIADANNHRVLLYDNLPLADGAPADLVLGQNSFSGNGSNFGGLDARSLNGPRALAMDLGRLLVSDASNHRVLAFDTVPGGDYAPADRLLGQAGSGAGDPSSGPARLSRPGGLAVAGGRLYAVDSDNHRLAIYDCLYRPTPTPSATHSPTSSPSPSLTPSSTPPALPLNEALDNAALSFNTGGDAPWYWQTAYTYDGQDAARAGIVGDDQHSWVEAALPQPGTVSFIWASSSEACCDKLTLELDGVIQPLEISGASAWSAQSFTVTAPGAHTLRWRFFRDSTVSSGQDTAWLDQVAFVPYFTPTPTPTSTPVQPKAGVAFSYPNPAAPGEAIHILFEPDAGASLEIYDWSLRKVLELPAGQVDAPAGRAHWDGRDASGRGLSSGMYFILVRRSSGTVKGKLTLAGP